MNQNKSLYGEKAAILVANGFNEQDMTAAQRVLPAAGAHVRIVAPEQRLINGWNGEGWGLHFAVDATLNQALAVDYSMLVIPGGRRSLEKLQLTAHTKRFIGGFLDAGKPVAVFDDALDLLVFSEKVAGRTVSGPKSLRSAAEQAGAKWSDESYVIDGNLMTGATDETHLDAFARAMADHFVSFPDQVHEAA